VPVFVWKGRTISGEIQTGELELNTQDEVLAALRKKRVIITSVREKPKGFNLNMPGMGPGVTTQRIGGFAGCRKQDDRRCGKRWRSLQFFSSAEASCQVQPSG
jgi:hypothetical protein